MDAIDASPIKFKLKRNVENLGKGKKKKKMRLKFKKIEDSLKINYAEYVAPDQSQKLIDLVLSLIIVILQRTWWMFSIVLDTELIMPVDGMHLRLG